MSQMFSSEGESVPVTLIAAEPNAVLLRRQADRDGYEAVQLGLPHKKGHAIKREFALQVDEGTKELTVSQFEIGETVEVSGTSKGKGFQGVVKRHGFKGGPASHGHRHELRSPGSIGTRFPQHVFKGKRMAGRMGADRVTVKNLSIVWIDPEKNMLAIKGAIPGTRGSVVEVISKS